MVEDSNLRTLSGHWFSKPARSTALPTIHTDGVVARLLVPAGTQLPVGDRRVPGASRLL